ncbi:DMT family transporter [Pelagibius litoralis]|uniref:DMT family transporter n=2 Tax=Pelagibius litoralis TaxID=374515 RepID=A0A967C8T5_9PROT|nr:DMT family transporter [Pelagibius litoralis]
MVAAFTTFAMLDATAKYLVQFYPTEQVVWARYAGHFVFALIIFWPRHGMGLIRSQRLGTQILRSLLLFTATCSNFVAVGYLQLAETSAIFFSTPLIVALFAVPLLGEKIGPRRWAAILVGFIGVMIVVRPGLGMIHWAAGLSLLTATAAALYQIITRKLAGVEPAATTQFYTALIGMVMITPFVPFVWQTPDLTGWLLMALLGALGGVGHWMLILAHRLAPAPILAPFNYTQIVPMVLLGFLVFGDLPDAWTLAGAAVVLTSGLYLLYRERRVKLAA